MTTLDLAREYRELGEAAGYHLDRAAEVNRARDALIARMFGAGLTPDEIAAAVKDRTADEVMDLIMQQKAGEDGPAA